MTATLTLASSPVCVAIDRALSVAIAYIYVVGYANRLPNDFTLKMLTVLKRCRRVLGVPPMHAPSSALPGCTVLSGCIATGAATTTSPRWRRRCSTRQRVTRRWRWRGMAARWSSVTVLLEQAPLHDLSGHVTTAPSALDGLRAQLALDPLEGTEIWDAVIYTQSLAQPTRTRTCCSHSSDCASCRKRTRSPRFAIGCCVL